MRLFNMTPTHGVKSNIAEKLVKPLMISSIIDAETVTFDHVISRRMTIQSVSSCSTLDKPLLARSTFVDAQRQFPPSSCLSVDNCVQTFALRASDRSRRPYQRKGFLPLAATRILCTTLTVRSKWAIILTLRRLLLEKTSISAMVIIVIHRLMGKCQPGVRWCNQETRG